MKVVVAGCGTGGAEFLRHYSGDVTVISPSSYLYCQALFPAYLAGKVSEDEVKVDLLPFFEEKGIKFRRGKVEFVKDKCKTVFLNLKTLKGVSYDKLVLAVGGEPIHVEGVEKALTLNDFESTKIAKKRIERAREVAIVGSGMSGVEVAYEISGFCNVTLIEYERRILPGMCEKVSDVVRKLLSREGVKILTSCKVERISDTLKTSCGEFSFDEVIWCAGIKGKRVPGLKYGKSGIVVDSSLKATQNVFAIGDVAEVNIGDVATKTALEAERQAKFVAKAIKSGKIGKYKPFSTLRNPFAIMTFDDEAILVRGDKVLTGKPIYKLKMLVVRKFLKNFER